MFNITVLLDVQANLPETSPFLSAQMTLVSTFFQMFIVLGMYNFEENVKICSLPQVEYENYLQWHMIFFSFLTYITTPA